MNKNKNIEITEENINKKYYAAKKLNNNNKIINDSDNDNKTIDGNDNDFYYISIILKFLNAF